MFRKSDSRQHLKVESSKLILGTLEGVVCGGVFSRLRR